MNVRSLTDRDIKWADYVFISAMVVQRDSVNEVVQRCKKLGVKMVAGGPLFTTEPEVFTEIDHLILNEAEITLAPFLADLAKGEAKHIYSTSEHPAVTANSGSNVVITKYEKILLDESAIFPRLPI